jgi:DNA-binding response OmpR family regulator
MTTEARSRALIVEDDPDIGQLLALYLQKAGFDATLLTNGREVVAHAKRQLPDVILLDVMLPGLDGLEVCRALRADPDTARVPLIMLTARADEVKLTAKEFLLLQYLMEHRGRVLSRDLLLTDVWGYSYTGGTRTVDVHVRRLREKLPFLAEAILTVKQFGYKLADPPPE